MSTKTTIKRIALVAVSALGLGMLSVTPSSALPSDVTVTVTNGTAGNEAGTVADTTTAALISVAALTTHASDTMTVSIIRKSAPTLGADITAHLGFVETSTVSTTVGNLVSTVSGMNAATVFDSKTAVSTGASGAYTIGGAVGYKSATFSVLLDTATVPAAGDYVYTVITSVYNGTQFGQFVSQSLKDVTITVDALATASTVVDPAQSSAALSAGATYVGGPTSDSSVATLATASATVKAVIRVLNNNASAAAVAESITVTVTGPGVVRKSGDTTAGKSIKVVGDGNDDIEILSDGTAGVASIVVATTSVTYPAKTVTFYAAAAKTITVATNKPVIGVAATTDVVRATAVDANGNVWAGTAYIVAATAADALIAGSSTPVACTYNSTYKFHACPVTGKLAGTANFNVIDASTVALATATSASTAAVTVSIGTPASAKISFDKATYAPGEKALVHVTVYDAAGKVIPAQTVTNAFAADIVSNVSFSSGNLTGSASPVIVANTDATVPQTAGTATYVVYMPQASGTVTLTATGSTGLATAGRVAVEASADVVNESVTAAVDAANEATDAANAATDAANAAAEAADAATAAAQDAQAAVAALATSVSSLIAGIKAQITSLTNLVIKIQKKVKA
jgi:hypothetical protein